MTVALTKCIEQIVFIFGERLPLLRRSERRLAILRR
jgi:hypothetical protein